MSIRMDEDIKRWTAKRKSALVLDIIQGKTTVAAASRAYDLLSPSEVESWVEDGKRGMENALRANPIINRNGSFLPARHRQVPMHYMLSAIVCGPSTTCPWAHGWYGIDGVARRVISSGLHASYMSMIQCCVALITCTTTPRRHQSPVYSATWPSNQRQSTAVSHRGPRRPAERTVTRSSRRHLTVPGCSSACTEYSL